MEQPDLTMQERRDLAEARKAGAALGREIADQFKAAIKRKS